MERASHVDRHVSHKAIRCHEWHDLETENATRVTVAQHEERELAADRFTFQSMIQVCTL